MNILFPFIPNFEVNLDSFELGLTFRFFCQSVKYQILKLG